jgi:methyl-accepting chemotaxis protein
MKGTMSSAPTPFRNSGSSLRAIAATGDLVMMITLAVNVAAAIAIGANYEGLPLAFIASALLLAIGGGAFAMARGTTASQVVLTCCNVAAVALHIQLGRGTVEFHFGVFVLLGLLLVYRDWKPVVLGAGLFAVHHVLFDRLQAQGLGFYCTPTADFFKIVIHAGYVIAQSSIEIYLALMLRRAAVEASELTAIVEAIDAESGVSLDVSGVATHAPTATMLKQAVLKMSAALSDVRCASASVEVAAREIAKGNFDLSQRTEEQASNLQQTAASMEQLTSTVRTTAETASEASRLAQSANASAVQGGAAVDKVVATMNEISESSRRIGDINGVIDGISFQTNILALNAAVEAARAGEQGRGFAVVANEVRALAQRSAQAAKEIKELIGVSTERVEAGTRLVDEAGAGMRDIVRQSEEVSRLIGEISGATGQQSIGIDQVGRTVSELDTVTQQNAALVEQGAAAAESLKHQALRLNDVVGGFALAPVA